MVAGGAAPRIIQVDSSQIVGREQPKQQIPTVQFKVLSLADFGQGMDFDPAKAEIAINQFGSEGYQYCCTVSHSVVLLARLSGMKDLES